MSYNRNDCVLIYKCWSSAPPSPPAPEDEPALSMCVLLQQVYLVCEILQVDENSDLNTPSQFKENIEALLITDFRNKHL